MWWGVWQLVQTLSRDAGRGDCDGWRCGVRMCCDTWRGSGGSRRGSRQEAREDGLPLPTDEAAVPESVGPVNQGEAVTF